MVIKTYAKRLMRDLLVDYQKYGVKYRHKVRPVTK